MERMQSASRKFARDFQSLRKIYIKLCVITKIDEEREVVSDEFPRTRWDGIVLKILCKLVVEKEKEREREREKGICLF